MTAQFQLTQPAIQDIEQIADHIASQSGLDQGDRFLNKLDAKFVKIAQFPNFGRQRDEILLGLRSLPMDNYLILYSAKISPLSPLSPLSSLSLEGGQELLPRCTRSLTSLKLVQ